MGRTETKTNHTPGPYYFRRYAQEAEDLEQLRKLGLKPTRMLTNEGQIALMAGTGDAVKRIALIDCQTRYKRGEGHKAECAEREANARLFAAVPDLVKALQLARARIEYLGAACSNPKHFEANASEFLPAIDAALALTATPARSTSEGEA